MLLQFARPTLTSFGRLGFRQSFSLWAQHKKPLPQSADGGACGLAVDELEAGWLRALLEASESIPAALGLGGSLPAGTGLHEALCDSFQWDA